jgi:radical SAM protein with 4Fe4S-binding SPASM domain
VRLAPKVDLNQIVLKELAPRVVLLEITQRCNYKCVHCIRDCPDHPAPDPMTTDDWKAVIDDVAAIGGIAVSVTGGEATVREDLVEILAHARARGLALSLKSNGWNLTLDYCRRLHAAGLRRMEVSLYGATRASHDRCTLVPGSFRRTIEGMLNARRAGIHVTVKFFAFRWNAHEYDRVMEWIRAHQPLMSGDRDYFLIRTDYGRTFGPETWATDEQIRYIEDRWPVRASEGSRNKAPTVQTCTMGIATACVTYAGDVLPCIMVRRSAGNVREKSFREVWADQTAFRPFRTLSSQKFQACNSCDHVSNCRICPGIHLSYTGSLYGAPEENCHITELVFGGPAAGPKFHAIEIPGHLRGKGREDVAGLRAA